MKKLSNKTKSVIAGASIIAVAGVTGIIAYFTDTESVSNHASMGIVDIDLNEYMLDKDGKKVEWKDRINIVPGDVISKIPEINVVEGAANCYVRAKVEITCRDDNLKADSMMLTLDNLDVDEDDWYYCENDGYFYYKTILTDKSKAIQFFTEVSIPATLDNEWALEEFTIDVTVDAIQSQNFTPNFNDDSSEPWLGITEDDIDECIYPTHVKYEE